MNQVLKGVMVHRRGRGERGEMKGRGKLLHDFHVRMVSLPFVSNGYVFYSMIMCMMGGMDKLRLSVPL